MIKKALRLLWILAAVQSACLTAIAQSNVSLALFSQLVTGAQGANGGVLITLNPGQTITRAPASADINWTVSPKTNVIVMLEYNDGQWDSLRLQFSKPVVASLRAGTPKALQASISAIHYRKDGSPNDYLDAEGVPVGMSFAAYPEMRLHLRIQPSPKSVLLGGLFDGLMLSPSLKGQGLFPVSLANSGGQIPNSFLLNLQGQTLLSFTHNGDGNLSRGSWIRLQTETDVTLKTFHYEPGTGETQFQSSPLMTTLAGGTLSAGQTRLVVSGGSTIHLGSLIGDSKNLSTAISLVDGAMSGALGPGSMIQVAENNLGQSKITPDPSQDSTIQHFDISIDGADIATMALHGTSIPVGGQHAVILFDHQDMLDMDLDVAHNTVLSIERGAWTDGGPSQCQGSLSAFSSAVRSGTLALDRSHLLVAGGTLSSEGLLIGLNENNTISGSISHPNFTLGSGSVIDAGSGAAFSLAGGTLSAGPSQSLLFQHGQDGGIGTFEIAIARITRGVLRIGERTLMTASSDGASFTAIRSVEKTLWSLSGPITIEAGTFFLDSLGAFAIEGGSVTANNVALNESGVAGGGITAVDLAIAPTAVKYGQEGHNLSVVAVQSSRLVTSIGSPLVVSPNETLLGTLSLTLPLSLGVIHFGDVGLMNLKSGNITLNATTALDLSTKITVDMNVQIASGSLSLSPGTDVSVGGGTITASGMAVLPAVGVVGSITRADFEILHSSFALNGGLRLSTGPGHLVMSDKYVVSNDGTSTSGQFDLTTSLNAIFTGTNSGLTATGGDLKLSLMMNNRDISTRPDQESYLHGSTVQFHDAKGDAVSLDINFNNLQLSSVLDTPATLTSDITGKLTKFDFSILTPGREGYHDDHGDHNDARFFSFIINVALDPTQESPILAPNFVLVAGQPVPSLTPELHLLLTLPQGDGEHPNSSIHESGNHGGPDRMQNAQEVFTDKYLEHRLHLYLLPGSYHVSAKVDVSSAWSGGKLKVTYISLSPSITRNESTTTQGWDRDGADGPFVKIVAVALSAVIGEAIDGPAGGLVLGGVAVHLLDFAEDKLDNWVNAQLVSRLQSVQLSTN